MRLFIAIVSAAVISACAAQAPTSVIRAAEAQGFGDVEVTDTHLSNPMAVGCSADDKVAYGIRAVRNGRYERRMVCCGPERENFSEAIVSY
jgi:hypothetical protein